jgi:hypothetical protein
MHLGHFTPLNISTALGGIKPSRVKRGIYDEKTKTYYTIDPFGGINLQGCKCTYFVDANRREPWK